MKKKKGFTLVELLVVIVILAIIMVLAIPGIMSVSKRMKQKGLENKFESIEQAAVVFAQENSNKIKDSLGGECNENSDTCECSEYTDKITGVTTKDCRYQFKMTVEDLIVNNYYKAEKNSSGCLVVDPTNNACLDCVVLTVKIDDDHKNSLGIIDREDYYLESSSLSSANSLGYEKSGVSYRCKDGKGNNPSYPGEKKGETPSTPSEPDEPTEPETPTNPITYGVMMKRDDSKNFWAQKENIIKIVFENTLNQKSNVKYTDDLSEARDGSIMSYLVPNINDNTKYTAYIQANGKIKANAYSSYLFSGFSNLQSIEGFEYFDTSEVTNMEGMFVLCSSLKSLDLSTFNTRKVTNMYRMFQNCDQLSELDISSFDTSSVTNIGALFSYCDELTKINAKNLDISKVTNMEYMFYECPLLTEINLSFLDHGNTKKSAKYMFSKCSNLTSLNLSNTNTENITDMSYMFYNCNNLISLNLSNFNTSSVDNMEGLFRDCSSLTSLNLSNFDTRKVTKMTSMFYNCKGY